MKKIKYLFPCMMLFMASCSLFELDNYEPHNATISGVFQDASTGENVEQEAIYNNMFGGIITARTTGYIAVYELGWDYEKAYYWLVKYDGSYSNTQVFAGTYRLEANENNFFPVVKDNVVIKKGSNTLDWTVTPYVRIMDADITFDGTVNKFKATFKLQYGDDTKVNTIYKAMLCCYPDKFVGIALNNCGSDPGASMTTGVVADGITVNTLYIDPAVVSNASEFKYERTHYFRIAVCAEGAGYNTSRHYNYSPTVAIQY
jgi:hypothetical protein